MENKKEDRHDAKINTDNIRKNKIRNKLRKTGQININERRNERR